jgi:hypothetical protein
MIREEIRGLREYIDGRIDDLKLDLNTRIGDLNTRLGETNKRIDSNFKWMHGIQVAMWVTIISAILLH